jgi:UDP:flavonoid glycosyltransferase YjiC (YdhE family)
MRLVDEPGFKTQAQKIGDTFREAGGAPKAADLIEGFLRERITTVA